MAIHQLTEIGGHSAGVILPKQELKEEGLLLPSGELTEMNMRIERFAPGAWQVLRTDLHDFPAFHEDRAYAQTARPTA